MPVEVYNPTLLIERSIREKKFFRIYKDFRPNLKAVAVTPKFYSSYEGHDLSLIKECYMEMLADYKYRIPSEKQSHPETENQRYGWYWKPLTDTDRNDRRLYRPTEGNPEIKLAVEMKRHLKKDPPFTGIPFKV